jgi:hypothetical protein
LRKPSYINIRKSYRINLVLLKKYDKLRPISHFRLTAKSLDAVRTACDLPCRLTPNSNDGTVALISTAGPPQFCHVATISRKPYPKPLWQEHPGYTRPEIHNQQQYSLPRVVPTYSLTSYHTENALHHMPKGHPLPSAERQPLLPLPTPGRPARSPWVMSLSRPFSPTLNRSGDTGFDPIWEAPDRQTRWTIVRAVLAWGYLCMGLAFLGLVGYFSYLGALKIVQAIVAFSTALKAEINAIVPYITKIVNAVVHTFNIVGRGLAAFGRGFAHLGRMIARLF